MRNIGTKCPAKRRRDYRAASWSRRRTARERRPHGRFVGTPSRAELERSFFLDDADKRLVAKRRGDRNRAGFALQLGTVRFLGTFLADPTDVPAEVLAYVAEQVGVAEQSCLDGYLDRRATRFEHTAEIVAAYGYRDFATAEKELYWQVDRLRGVHRLPALGADEHRPVTRPIFANLARQGEHLLPDVSRVRAFAESEGEHAQGFARVSFESADGWSVTATLRRVPYVCEAFVPDAPPVWVDDVLAPDARYPAASSSV